MSFRQHKTIEQKKERLERYWLLRYSGIEPRKALIFRDWTDNKIAMIISGEAKPCR